MIATSTFRMSLPGNVHCPVLGSVEIGIGNHKATSQDYRLGVTFKSQDLAIPVEIWLLTGIFVFSNLKRPSIFSRPVLHGLIERGAKGAFGAVANCPRDGRKRLIACLEKFACDLHPPVQEVHHRCHTHLSSEREREP